MFHVYKAKVVFSSDLKAKDGLLSRGITCSDDLGVSLASSAAISASDHDFAFQLQLSEAIQASLLLQPSSSNANVPAAALPEVPSDASCALSVHDADLARAEQDRRDAQDYHARAAASLRLAAHDALFARDLAAIPDDRWAHDGDHFERPLHDAGCHGMIGIWSPRQKKLADIINEALSAKHKFQQCEILCVPRNQIDYVTKLAANSLHTQIAKAVAVNAGKEKRENCTICLEDTDVSKIHAVEGCAHRFCFSCMKEHVKVKLLHGMLPACPQDGCATKLTVEGSKIFLSPRLLAIMVQRIREAQIPPTQKIYCPYPKCSALMSMSELIHPMQASSSKYTAVDAVTLRKCVKCTGSFCISCKVPWHDHMTCYEYKRRYPHARLEDAYLQNLAQQRLWRQCIRCKHMIELAEGCYHMTCVCGYEFCYTCGKEWKEKKATCSCPLWDERNIIRDDPQGNAVHDDPEDEDDDYYDDDDNNYYVGEGLQYNVDYHRQYDGGDRHRDHFYQYNR
uniref:RBR-type E3 ubiquitin transferase n=1 Tax=Leersia perrieri TaxID=77586 RepID=A0A0D9XVX7_9ORYZ